MDEILPAGSKRSVDWRRRLTWVLVAAALAQPVAWLLARWDWRADLLTHLQTPAIVLTIVAFAVTVRRRRRLAVAMAALLVSQIAPLVRFHLPASQPSRADRPRLRVLVANVMNYNQDRSRLPALIRAESPDIVGLIEVTDGWLASLTEVRRDYPYRLEFPSGARGLSLWSRRPLIGSTASEVLLPTPSGNPALHADIEFDGRPLRIWLVHPPNPLGTRGRSRGRSELEFLARRIARDPDPRLVIGDLNRTEGSPLFADFLRTTRLRDSRLGFGRQPSWPSWSPYRIPIDHAFLSDELTVLDRRLGPNIGSDHFPVILELAPAASFTKADVQSAHLSP